MTKLTKDIIDEGRITELDLEWIDDENDIEYILEKLKNGELEN